MIQLNNTLFDYSTGTFSTSYFMLEDIQNLTLHFDVDFTVLVNDSTIFDNSSAPSISFMVSTVP